jgi:endonuclease-3
VPSFKNSALVNRAKAVQGILDELFPDPPIPLHHTTPFTLLIAVLLSAQCTDERVNKVTPELFRIASTPEAMAKLSVEVIQETIRSCGLAPTKAKAIKALSQQIVERHEGSVPATFEALEALPGVGHKTASVVMSQAFKHPAFPVDTHIFRAAHRWGLSKGKTVEAVEKDLKKIFPKDSWNRLHLQIIYFCRAYCPARGHESGSCPICKFIG